MNRSPIPISQSPATSSVLSPQSSSLKIIVRAPNWVGDCVLAVPFLKLLREKNPKAHITVLAKRPGNEIFEGNPNADLVWTHEDFRETAGRLRREKFDLGYILPNSFSSALLFFLGGVRKRTGYAAELRSLLLTERLPWKGELEHRALRYCRLAGAPGGEPATPSSYPCEIFLDPSSREQAQNLLRGVSGERLVVLNPCSNAPSRRWPAARYAALAKRLTEDLGAEVVLLGSSSPQDFAATAEVEKNCGSSRLHNFCGRTTLKSAAAILAQARLLVTNESGMMHLGAAAKVPILALVGAADTNVTGPWTRSPVEILNKHVWCSPCVKNRCINKETPMICMETIEVDEAASVVEKMVK